jgi:hypothetical protein
MDPAPSPRFGATTSFDPMPLYPASLKDFLNA